jgi:hypothetical protein
MAVQWEPASPIGLAGNIYADNFALQLQRQNQEARNQQMAQANSRGGGGGPSGGGLDMQAAIQHRDQMQFAQQQQVDANANQQSQQAFQSRNNQQRASLDAQLSQEQLTQQETMRLARLNNAVGDVTSDPTLSDEEKRDLVMQLKTNKSPLEQRQQAAKLKSQQLANEEKTKEMQLQGALQKAHLDALGKSSADRTSFIPDPEHLSAISDDLNKTLPQFPAVSGGDAARQKVIEKLAHEEAVRQGLGSNVVTSPDGKTQTFISGPGSKEHEARLKGEHAGGAARGEEMTHEKFLKAREYAERIVDKRATETVEGTIPGTKVPAHPELQDLDKRAEAVKKHLRDIGAPTTFEELEAMKKDKPKGYGYDPDKAAWNKAKPAAAATTPAGENAPAAAPKPEVIESINNKAKAQANGYLNDTRLAPPVRTQMAESVGIMRRALVSVGGDTSKLTGKAKEEFEAARKFMNANDPDKGSQQVQQQPQPTQSGLAPQPPAGSPGSAGATFGAAMAATPEAPSSFRKFMDRPWDAVAPGPETQGAINELGRTIGNLKLDQDTKDLFTKRPEWTRFLERGGSRKRAGER